MIYLKKNYYIFVAGNATKNIKDNQIKENKMKDTAKTLMIIACVGFTLIAITWVGMLATLLITWLGGNI